MKKKMLLTLFFLLAFPCLAMATRGPNLVALYGQELYDVPAVIRRTFEEDTKRAWYDTTYEERAHYLAIWHQRKAMELKEQKIREKKLLLKKKKQAQMERERYKEKREEIKEQTQKDRAKRKEERDKEKKRRQLIKERERFMKELKKAQRARSGH